MDKIELTNSVKKPREGKTGLKGKKKIMSSHIGTDIRKAIRRNKFKKSKWTEFVSICRSNNRYVYSVIEEFVDEYIKKKGYYKKKRIKKLQEAFDKNIVDDMDIIKELDGNIFKDKD